MSYDGYTGVTTDGQDHLGGNVFQGDPYTYCPTIWSYLIDRFCLRSVLDVGSGRGFAADYFYRKGIRVIAMEGLEVNVEKSLYPAVKHDLTKGPFSCKVDLVHCQELVEHIEEKYLNNLLDTLTCGNYLVMTHALPGQGGHHHVNCQPQEYWVNHLKSRGYNLLEEDTIRLLRMASIDGAVYMRQSGMIFAKGQ